MRIESTFAVLCLTTAIAGCGGGDINLTPTNIDNSVNNSTTTGGGSNNPCANYTDPTTNTLKQGTFDGTNCSYNADFVGAGNPLTVDLTIPFLSGTHIFEDGLFVGENVTSGTAPAGGTGPTLTIRPGNKLAFLDSADYVLINRGSTIIADGSPSAPITFTAFADAVLRTAAPEDVALWGGIVINGNGRTNNCTDAQVTANQCHVVSEGQPSNYGGGNNTESSGILRYVVVKHTGFEVAPDDELNGITFNAVGSGTIVSHVETYSTFDDGIEFFGGAVNVDHFVALYVKDDSIDYSDGYVGTIDKALVIHSATDGNRCIEGDNIGDTRFTNGESPVTPPLTNPVVQGMTCITSNRDGGTHGDSEGPTLRRGPQTQLKDSIVYGFYAPDAGVNNECLDPEDSSTRSWFQGGQTTISQTIIACEQFVASGRNLANSDTIQNWFLNTSAVGASYPGNVNNRIYTSFATPPRLLTARTYFTAPVLLEPNLTTPIAMQPASGQMGAVTAANDWTVGWTYGLKANNRGQPLWFE